jgi:hypothetical protein
MRSLPRGASGIEVFLDQSELRGGDAWDQKIRREFQDCALFIPVISANTAALFRRAHGRATELSCRDQQVAGCRSHVILLFQRQGR